LERPVAEAKEKGLYQADGMSAILDKIKLN